MWKQNDQKNYKKWWNFSGLNQKLSRFIGEKVLPLSLEQEHFSLDQKKLIQKDKKWKYNWQNCQWKQVDRLFEDYNLPDFDTGLSTK